ncbi:MAG TPA: glycosyltransferase [Azospirillaceae bacterium]|nr:glycosyltransferase [Azospirillaceae bacterium]
MQENQPFADLVERWEAEEDDAALAKHIETAGIGEMQILQTVQWLLVNGKLASGLFLSRYMVRCGKGQGNLIVGFARALDGIIRADPGETRAGLDVVSYIIDHAPADLKTTVFRSLFLPAIRLPVLLGIAQADNHYILRLLDLFKAADPLMREIFDFSASAPPVDTAGMRQRSRSRGPILEYASPPPGKPRRRRSVVVAMPRLYIPTHPKSRPNDSGPVTCAAMQDYGWDAHCHGVDFAPSVEDYVREMKGIADRCAEVGADVLVFDDVGARNPASHPLRDSFLRYLRGKLPAIKIIAAYLDPWAFDDETLIYGARSSDLVWAMSPSVGIWSHEAFRNKTFFLPIPRGPVPPTPPVFAPLPREMVFPGGISEGSYHRAFWLAGAEAHGIPIRKVMSTHLSDGLDALASYRSFCDRMGETGCVLNLSMRVDHSLPMTARTFEATLTGALLIQERSPDVDLFFTAGEHYLDFATFAELKSAATFLRDKPDEAEQIRRNGTEFARARYSSDKVVGCLDHLLDAV